MFLESRTPGKASVLIKIRNGAKLPPQNLAGITHMVASAVEGLAPGIRLRSPTCMAIF